MVSIKVNSSFCFLCYLFMLTPCSRFSYGWASYLHYATIFLLNQWCVVRLNFSTNRFHTKSIIANLGDIWFVSISRISLFLFYWSIPDSRPILSVTQQFHHACSSISASFSLVDEMNCTCDEILWTNEGITIEWSSSTIVTIEWSCYMNVFMKLTVIILNLSLLLITVMTNYGLWGSTSQ